MLKNQPTDLMAMAGLATGDIWYNMTTAQIASAKAFLKQLSLSRAQALYRRTPRSSGR